MNLFCFLSNKFFKGSRPPISHLGFELLVQNRIVLMKNSSLKCVDLIYEKLLNIIEHCAVHDMERFPRLGDRINEVVTNLIRSRIIPTKDMVQNLIDMHCAYINTKHPDFTFGKSWTSEATSNFTGTPQFNLAANAAKTVPDSAQKNIFGIPEVPRNFLFGPLNPNASRYMGLSNKQKIEVQNIGKIIN